MVTWREVSEGGAPSVDPAAEAADEMPLLLPLPLPAHQHFLRSRLRLQTRSTRHIMHLVLPEALQEGMEVRISGWWWPAGPMIQPGRTF